MKTGANQTSQTFFSLNFIDFEAFKEDPAMQGELLSQIFNS